MTPEQRQEEISKAYAHAVAASCGFSIGTWTQDHGCVDTTIGAASTLGEGTIARPKVDIQLKATRRQDLERDTHFCWRLDRDHYNPVAGGASVAKRDQGAHPCGGAQYA